VATREAADTRGGAKVFGQIMASYMVSYGLRGVVGVHLGREEFPHVAPVFGVVRAREPVRVETERSLAEG